MIYQFYVEVEIKNNAITRDTDERDVAAILMDSLEENKLDTLPWVINHHYYYANSKE